MFEFIGRWLGGKPPAPPTRLSQEEVLAIARRAAADSPVSEYLTMATPELREGKTVWIVNSATIGMMLEVLIDDGNGEVLKIRRIGVR